MKAQHWPGLSEVPFVDHGWAEANRAVPAGAFEVETLASGQRLFWFKCPGACKSIVPIALRPVVNGAQQSWEWDGNDQAPTLTPSINHVGCWHGWLTGGEFRSC